MSSGLRGADCGEGGTDGSATRLNGAEADESVEVKWEERTEPQYAYDPERLETVVPK